MEALAALDSCHNSSADFRLLKSSGNDGGRETILETLCLDDYHFFRRGCFCHLATGEHPLFSPADQNPMSDLLQLELTDRQRELLLRGLRFVRSSRMLEIRDTAEITDDQRRDELGEIRQLAEMLGKDAGKPARV
jgi:hypothetical protein